MSSAAQPAPPLTALRSSGSAVLTKSAAAVGSVPWYLWVGALAVTSASFGGSWDVAWHRSIGRDSFWTPAHMAIYLCGVLASLVGLWLVAQAILNRDPALRSASVSILGLRAPLGVILAGWGGLAMMTSAPFDNWRQRLRAGCETASPPHTLLIAGVRAVGFGMLFLILAAMNRAVDAGPTNFLTLRRLFLYVGGLAVGGQMFFFRSTPPMCGRCWHSVSIAAPVLFATLSQASRFDGLRQQRLSFTRCLSWAKSLSFRCFLHCQSWVR